MILVLVSLIAEILLVVQILLLVIQILFTKKSHFKKA